MPGVGAFCSGAVSNPQARSRSRSGSLALAAYLGITLSVYMFGMGSFGTALSPTLIKSVSGGKVPFSGSRPGCAPMPCAFKPSISAHSASCKSLFLRQRSVPIPLFPIWTVTEIPDQKKSSTTESSNLTITSSTSQPPILRVLPSMRVVRRASKSAIVSTRTFISGYFRRTSTSFSWLSPRGSDAFSIPSNCFPRSRSCDSTDCALAPAVLANASATEATPDAPFAAVVAFPALVNASFAWERAVAESVNAFEALSAAPAWVGTPLSREP